MRSTSVIILAAMLAAGGPAWAANPQTTTTKTTTQQTDKGQQTNLGSVRIGERNVFKLAAADGMNPQQRADFSRSAILHALKPETGSTIAKQVNLPGDVKVESRNKRKVITLFGKTIATVTATDTKANGLSQDALANQWAQQLRDALADLNINARTAYQAIQNDIAVAGAGTQPQTQANQPGNQTQANQPATGNDAQLAVKIRNRLKKDPSLRNEAVNVEAANGVVTLKGTVRDRATEQKVVDTVRKMEGVGDVRSDLRIQGQ